MKTSDTVRLILDLQRRMEILEEHVLGTLPVVLEPPNNGKIEGKKASIPKRKKKKAVQEDFELDLSKLPLMSTTEIVQACRQAGHTGAGRGMLREDLVALLLGEAIDVDDPLEDVRTKTFGFVQNNEHMLRSVMECSLHCPTCPHSTVVECWTSNHDLIDP